MIFNSFFNEFLAVFVVFFDVMFVFLYEKCCLTSHACMQLQKYKRTNLFLLKILPSCCVIFNFFLNVFLAIIKFFFEVIQKSWRDRSILILDSFQYPKKHWIGYLIFLIQKLFFCGHVLLLNWIFFCWINLQICN